MMRLSAIAHKGLLLLGVVVLLSGCFGSKPVLEELGEEGKGTIKILYYNEDDFYREYGNAFNVKFPNIEFDIVSTKELMDKRRSGQDFDYRSELAKWVDLHKPDVLLLGGDEYEEYAQAGKLFNLEPIIKQEQFDVDGYMPGLIDSLREKGGGSLYGLTPNFLTSVIFYNADLFAEHGIELPRSGLSWQELFDLAARFKGAGTVDEPVYGLYAGDGDAAELLDSIARTLKLQRFDAQGESVLLESEGWKQAFRMTADAVRSRTVKVLGAGEAPSYLPSDDLFMNGQAAMVIAGSGLAYNINDPSYSKKAKKFEWGIVPVPVDPANPGESPFASYRETFAISAESANKRAAWEFIKYVAGPERASADAQGMLYQLPTRIGYVKDLNGKSAEPLYALKPMDRKYERLDKKIPKSFDDAYAPLLNEALQAVIDQTSSVDEALANLQQQAQAALQAARSGQ
ncbi:extracellular solute-binding protein [Paenibacillus thiaminolyticus]|uniref:ABC transporter substrate-binding protein n=1 Tax=Paenibacillus thiaminolyticus TaxID=49283 RepID=UPI00116265B3|nr:extracellular solute-binding protein [Paenibacillus thiaminolyticus]MDG0872559.1 extracellular solute-binding protein [Paenibacillus thiaminolyticus]NGP61150.1 extracellular solute-binding protein [Paenibacillus thiaminolyticus]WCR25283.1 extracellular solute-binding protein [Paenibacillus thiaminolyticus]